MRWEVNKAKGSGISYIADAEETPVPEAVRELWSKYVADAAGKNEALAWDHLRVEMWLDSGRIILFPATLPYRRRVEAAVCQIKCAKLLRDYEALVTAGLSDGDVEKGLQEQEARLVALLSESAKETELPRSVDRNAVRVLYYGADLENPIREDVFFR